MNERVVTFDYFLSGVLASDKLIYCELPFAWTLLGVKACSLNDSDATLEVSVGGSAVIAEAVIGDSGDPSYLQPTNPAPVDADEVVWLDLDFDGGSGTAGENVSMQVIGLVGE